MVHASFHPVWIVLGKYSLMLPDHRSCFIVHSMYIVQLFHDLAGKRKYLRLIMYLSQFVVETLSRQ